MITLNFGTECTQDQDQDQKCQAKDKTKIKAKSEEIFAKFKVGIETFDAEFTYVMAAGDPFRYNRCPAASLVTSENDTKSTFVHISVFLAS